MKLLRSLWDSPVESLSALVLIAVGVYVSAIGSSAPEHKAGLLAAGGLLTTFGGVMFAWVVSKAVATERARSEFRQQLGHLSRNLGQAAGQISRTIEQSQATDISSETALALISQANRMIYGQVSEISVIQGTGFDPAYLLDTAAKLDDVARQLESDDSQGEELESVRRQLQEVRTSLSSASPRRTYSRAPVKCPECQKQNDVELGDFPGDTASISCTFCGERFNAHRASDGSAFSRPVGPAPKAQSSKGERWSFSCPACDQSASTWLGEGTKTMVCFGCYRPMIVDMGKRSVENGAGQFTHARAAVVGRQGSRPQVCCPECGNTINAFILVEDCFVGICYRDKQVMEVVRSDFETWTPDGVVGSQADTDGASARLASAGT